MPWASARARRPMRRRERPPGSRPAEALAARGRRLSQGNGVTLAPSPMSSAMSASFAATLGRLFEGSCEQITDGQSFGPGAQVHVVEPVQLYL